MPENKYVQMHPTVTQNGVTALDETVNVFPIIGPDSFKGFNPSAASPGVFVPQEKLVSSGAGQNIKTISWPKQAAIPLLGSGNINIPLLDLIYPIGSVYISYTIDSETCPIETALGGHWIKIKGKFLYAADGEETVVGNEGGYKGVCIPAHSHTLTINSGGEHSHNYVDSLYDIPGALTNKPHAYGAAGNEGQDEQSKGWEFYTHNIQLESLNKTISSSGSHQHSGEISAPISSTTEGMSEIPIVDDPAELSCRNMPPYRVVSMWYRAS